MVGFPKTRAKPRFQFADAVFLEHFDATIAKHASGFDDMVSGAAINQRMGAAGVVAEHASDAATVAR